MNKTRLQDFGGFGKNFLKPSEKGGNDMKILYRQYNLQDGDSHLTAWLGDGLKKGNRVQLRDAEDTEKWWTVAGMGDTLLPKDEIKGSHNSKDWHKNDYHGRLNGIDTSGK